MKKTNNAVLGSLALFAFAAILPAAWQQGSQQTSPQATPQKAPAGASAMDTANGKAVYTKSCQKCHAADGKGNPGIAKALKVTLRALGSPEVLAKSDEQLAKESTQGIGKMKPVPLSEKDTKDVVAYMRAFREGQEKK